MLSARILIYVQSRERERMCVKRNLTWLWWKVYWNGKFAFHSFFSPGSRSCTAGGPWGCLWSGECCLDLRPKTQVALGKWPKQIWLFPVSGCLISLSPLYAVIDILFNSESGKKESESEIAQSCPTLCHPMDCSPPPSMGFSRKEYWSGLPFPSLGDLPNPGIKPRSPTL